MLALNDPETDRTSLQQLLAECAAHLTALVTEGRELRKAVRTQIEEIATLVASREAVWPEEIARLQALSEEIRNRADMFEVD